jgi:hypothetical protein
MLPFFPQRFSGHFCYCFYDKNIKQNNVKYEKCRKDNTREKNEHDILAVRKKSSIFLC